MIAVGTDFDGIDEETLELKSVGEMEKFLHALEQIPGQLKPGIFDDCTISLTHTNLFYFAASAKLFI